MVAMPDRPENLTPSTEVRDELARQGRPVIVAMSRGKDSLSAWTSLIDAGVTCVPVHLDVIPKGNTTPGLSFVDESIDELEQHFQTRIHRLPHPSFYRWLNSLVYQAPERCGVIEAAMIGDYDYDDLWARFRDDQDLAPDTWVAVGVRAADSPMRRVAMSSWGAWRHRPPGSLIGDRSRGPNYGPDPGKWEVHVVWDWKIADVRAQLARHHVKLPKDYQWFNRSFDGIDDRFLRQLRDHSPADYQRVLDWFPFADLTIHRTDMEKRYAPAS